ncbi:MAG: hypothetical protein UT37_C0009G0002 [Parcubacteria group bacterium GW2011_GWA2_39_18]|nr:MAG: hypothetical protein UT37_C0009G0002 [Parcubacteria group bacterium GW2011_GWA2_39_18]
MLDIVTIGHSTIDIIAKIPDAHLHCRKDEKTCELCFSYGQKLSADSIDECIGGNAPNVAIGLKRLGFETSVISNLGQDEKGLKIRQILQKEGVDDSHLKNDSFNPTDVSLILSYQAERTILAHHSPFVYLMPRSLKTPQWIYLTSLGKSFHKLYDGLRDYLVENSNVKLALNPGLQELNWGAQGARGILERADILILNKEEAEILAKVSKITIRALDLGYEQNGTNAVRWLLEGLKGLGPKIVVITDAKNGAFSYDGNNFLKIKPFPADLVEMTGAGDAFSSGLLGALMNDQSLAEALRWGAGEAAAVIGKVGSTVGLLNKKELRNLLNLQKEITAESF